MDSLVELNVADGIAELALNAPPVNALSDALLVALDATLRRVQADPAVRALVLTGRGAAFVAGADLERLQRLAQGEPPSPDVPSLGDVITALERGKPAVAAIRGFALGGGLELALGCHARVATAEARLGLPELGLGLIPGAGGTQRLPRVIGLDRALEAILSGKPLGAAEAEELGLLDEVVAAPDGATPAAGGPGDALMTRARARARALAEETSPRVESLWREIRVEGPGTARDVAAAALARHARRFVGQRQGEAAVEAVLAGFEQGGAAGLARERALFGEVLREPAARSLLHLFFAERAAPRLEGAPRPTPATASGRRWASTDTVAVIGGGTMGSGIATALLSAGLGVTLVETGEAELAAGMARVHQALARLRKGAAPAEGALRLEGTTTLERAATAALVIEAATERVALKQALFQRLGDTTPPGTLLATNTSTIDLETLASVTAHPERVLGLHFFSPAHVMRLVEVVRGPRTAPAALEDALGLVKALKKVPVIVRSCPGFLVNRMFMPWGRLAGLLVDRGLDPYRVDAAMLAFGMPMGPFRMGDLAGLDVGVAAAAVLDEAFPERTYRSTLRARLVALGRLGEKSGAGFYRHQDGRALPDPAIEAVVAGARADAGHPAPLALDDAAFAGPASSPAATSPVARLLVLGVVNEACRALGEGVAQRPSDVDVAAVLGYGFPAWRGGPLHLAEQGGLGRAVDDLRAFRDATGLGWLEPCEYLTAAARRGRW